MVVLGQPGFDDFNLGADKEKKKKGSFEEFANENLLQDPSKIIQPIPNQSKEQIGENLFIGNTDNAFLPGGTIHSDVTTTKGNENLFLGTTEEHPASQDMMDYFNDYANSIIAPAVGAEPGTLSVTDPSKLSPEIERFERMKTARPIPEELSESERIMFDSEVLESLDNATSHWATYRDGEWIQDREDKYGSKIRYKDSSTRSKVLHKLNKISEYIESNKWQEDGITLGLNELQDIMMSFQGLEVIGRNAPKEYEDAIKRFYKAITQDIKPIDPGLTDKYYKSKPGLEYKSSIITNNMEEQGFMSKTFELAKGTNSKLKKLTSPLDPFVPYMAALDRTGIWGLGQAYFLRDNGRMPKFSEMQQAGLEALLKTPISGQQIKDIARVADPSGVFALDSFGPSEEQGTVGEFIAKAIGTHDTSSNMDKWTNPAGVAAGFLNWIGPENLAGQTSLGNMGLNLSIGWISAPAKVATMKASKNVMTKILGHVAESVIPGNKSWIARSGAEALLENAFLATGGAIEQNQENLPDVFQNPIMKTSTQLTATVLTAMSMNKIGGAKTALKGVEDLQKAGTTGDREAFQFTFIEDMDNAASIRYPSQTLEIQEKGSTFSAVDSTERNVASTVRNANINGTTIKTDWTKNKKPGEIFQDVKKSLVGSKLIKSAKQIKSEGDWALMKKTENEAIKEYTDKSYEYELKNIDDHARLNKEVGDWADGLDARIEAGQRIDESEYDEILQKSHEIDELKHAIKNNKLLDEQKDFLLENFRQSLTTAPSFRSRARAYLNASPLGHSVININNVDDFVRANMKIYKFDKLPNKKEIEKVVRAYGNRMEASIRKLAPEAGADAMGLILRNVRRPKAWTKSYYESVDRSYSPADSDGAYAFASGILDDPDTVLGKELAQLDVHAKFISVNQTATKENLHEVMDTFFHEAAHTYHQVLKNVIPAPRYNRMMRAVSEWYLQAVHEVPEDLAKAVLDTPEHARNVAIGNTTQPISSLIKEAEGEGFAYFMAHVARNPEKYLSSQSSYIKEMESGLDFIRGLMNDMKLEGDSVTEGAKSLKARTLRDVDEAVQPIQRDGYAGVLDWFGDPASAHMTPITKNFLHHTTPGTKHYSSDKMNISPKQLLGKGDEDIDDVIGAFFNELVAMWFRNKQAIGKSFTEGTFDSEKQFAEANIMDFSDFKVNSFGRTIFSAFIKHGNGQGLVFDMTSPKNQKLVDATKEFLETAMARSDDEGTRALAKKYSNTEERVANAQNIIRHQLRFRHDVVDDRLGPPAVISQDPYQRYGPMGERTGQELDRQSGPTDYFDIRSFVNKTGIDEIMEGTISERYPALKRSYDNLLDTPGLVRQGEREGLISASLDEQLPLVLNTKRFVDQLMEVASKDMRDFNRDHGAISIDSVRGMIREFVDKGTLNGFRDEIVGANSRVIEGLITTFWDNTSIARQMSFTPVQDMATSKSVFGDQIFFHGSAGKYPKIQPEKMNLLNLHASGVYATEHLPQALMYMMRRITEADQARLPSKSVFEFSETGTMHSFKINVPESQHLNLDDQIQWESYTGIGGTEMFSNKFVDMWVDLTEDALENFRVQADKSPLRNFFDKSKFTTLSGGEPTVFDYIRLLRSRGNLDRYKELKGSLDKKQDRWAVLETHKNATNLMGLLGDKKFGRQALIYSLVSKDNKTYKEMWNRFAGQKGILYGQNYFGEEPISIATLIDQLDTFSTVHKKALKTEPEFQRDKDLAWVRFDTTLNEQYSSMVKKLPKAERAYSGAYKKLDFSGGKSNNAKKFNKDYAYKYMETMRDTHNIRALSHMSLEGPQHKFVPARVPILLARTESEFEDLVVRGDKSIFHVDEGFRKPTGDKDRVEIPPEIQAKPIRRPNIWGEDAYKNKWNKHGDIGKVFAEDAIKMSPPKENAKNFMGKVHKLNRVANVLNDVPPSSPRQQVLGSMVRAGDDLVEVTFAGDKDLVPQSIADILAKPTSLDANGDLTDDGIKEIADESRSRMAGFIEKYRKIKNLTDSEIEAINRQNAAAWMKSPGPDIVPFMKANSKKAESGLDVQAVPISKVEFKAMIEHSHKVFRRMSDTGKKEGYTAMRAQEGLEKLFGMMASGKKFGKPKPAEMLESSELSAMEVIFGKQVVDAINKSQRDGWATFRHLMIDLLNFPRTIVASLDYSALFLQGFMLVGHPGSFIRAAGTGLKAAVGSWGDGAFRKIEADMIKDPVFDYLQRRGLYFASDGLHQREETFISGFAMRIPGISHSARAHTTFLNRIRFDVAKKAYINWKKQGLSETELDLNMKHLCRFLNHASGRGDLGKVKGFDFNKASPVLNMAFFSPRLLVSRFQAPVDVLFAQGAGAKYARNLMLKDLAASTTLAVSIMAIMKAGGGEVQADPRSADFGKGKFGPTRINFTGGYAPLISNMWKLMTGSAMTSSGDAMPLIGGRKDHLMRFVRSKMSPQAHIAYDLWRGKNFYGQDIDFGDQNVLAREGLERFTPLAVQELYDATQENWHNPSQSILSAFSLIGGPTNTYHTKADLSQAIYSRSVDQLHPWEKMMLTRAMELGGKYDPSVYDKRNSEIDYELFQMQKGLVRKYEASLKDVRAGKKTKKELLTQVANEFYDLKDDAFQRKDENYKAEAKAMGWQKQEDGDEIKIQVGPGEPDTLANAYLAYKYLGQQMREEDEGKYRVSDYENGFWERFDEIAEKEGFSEDQMEYLYANINMNPLPEELLKHPDIAKKIKTLGRFEKSEKARASIAKKHSIAYPEGTDLGNVPEEYGFGESGTPSSEERIKQLETRYPHLPEMAQ